MSAIIKQIIIFNEIQSKRFVEFDSGLNIITGDSKTGKSALIEIVDYCLFSSRSSIPFGKITDFAKLYVVIYQIDEYYIVVGRPAPKTSESKQAYLNIETDYDKLKDIKIDYFYDLALKPIKNDVQTEFEEYLGLSLKNLASDFESLGKLSIRDTVSFLFQHQNIIANKHALFYRFDDISKRRRVILALPVLLGLANGEYFELIKKLQEVERKIKAEEKILEKILRNSENQKEELRELIEIYYSLLDLTLEEDLSLLELRKRGENLPMPSKALSDQVKVFDQITKLEEERELLYHEKFEIEESISNLLSNSNDGLDYGKSLERTYSLQKHNDDEFEELSCPLCENIVSEINENLRKLEDSKSSLIDELLKLNSYSKDSTHILEKFRTRQKELKQEIKSITKRIGLLVEENSIVEVENRKRENILYKKGVIETSVKHLIQKNDISEYNTDLIKLKGSRSEINLKLNKYDKLKTFKTDTEKFLKRHMDRIANKLDFEKELKPIDFYFDIEDFSFYHKNNGSKIRLDEMGSGANWLACHLSLFISFMHLSAQNEKSVIPNFLMIDQPSQVYFPRTAKKSELDEEDGDRYDDNITQVRQIFKVLNEEIKLIEEETGVKAQIIVLEHANDDDFDEFIVRDWDKSKGQGLI